MSKHATGWVNAAGPGFQIRFDSAVRRAATWLTAIVGVASLNAGELTPVTLGLTPRSARTAPVGASGSPVVSSDGRYVFFVSDARNLVTNAVESWGLNLYRWSRESNTTELVSTGMGNLLLSSVGDYSVSEDGERAVFSGLAIPYGTPDEGNVFLRDIPSRTTTLISKRRWELDPIPGNGPSWDPSLSSDGRWAVFSSTASDLDTIFAGPNLPALIVHEVASGESRRIVSSEFVTEHEISREGDLVIYQNPERQFFPGGRRWTSLILWKRDENTYTQVGLPRPASDVMGTPLTPMAFALSPNGRHLAFHLDSRAGADDRGVWMYDLRTETAERILAQRPSEYFEQFSWSNDGTRLAFVGQDFATGVLGQVQVWTEGVGVRPLAGWVQAGSSVPSNPAAVVRSELSPEGRYLLFRTADAVPAAGVPEAGSEAYYLWELATGKARLIAREQADLEPVFSADGRWLAYQSSERLDPADDNGSSDVFVMKLPDGAPERVSQGLAAEPLATASGESWVDGGLSDDGRWIVFSSNADDLAPGDTNGRHDVFVHDRLLRTNLLVSVTGDGRSAVAGANWGRISAGGRSVLFQSRSPDLAGSSPNPGPNLFVRDLSRQRTTLISVDASTGKALGQEAANAWISGDGREVIQDLQITYTYQDDHWEGRPARLLHWDEATGVTEDWTQRLTALAGGARYHLPGTVHISRNAEILAFSFSDGSGVSSEVWDRSAGTLTPLPIRIDSRVTDVSPNGRWVLTLHGPAETYDPVGGTWIPVPRSYTIYDRVRGVAAPVTFPDSLAPSVPSFTGDSEHLMFFSPVAQDGGRPSRRQPLLYSLRDGAVSPILNREFGDLDLAKARCSPDLRWMIFTSVRPGSVEEDRNEASDVFLYDRYSGSLRTLSTRPTGATGDGPSVGGHLSADGRFFAFTTFAGDLLPGDDSRYSDVVWGAVEPMNPVDTDADGLPDVWERDWFGSLDQGAAGDPDGDGQSNLDEYRSRTSPSDATSRLAMSDAKVRPDGVEVSWEGHSGVSYRLEQSGVLDSGVVWSPLGEEVVGYEGRMHQLIPGSATTAFFRVLVTP